MISTSVGLHALASRSITSRSLPLPKLPSPLRSASSASLVPREPPHNHKPPNYLETSAPLDKDSACDLEKTSVQIPNFTMALFPNSAFAAEPPVVLGALDRHEYSLQENKWLNYSSPTLQDDGLERTREVAYFLNDLSRRCWAGYENLLLPRPDVRRVWTLTESIRVLPDGSSMRTTGAALVKTGLKVVRWSDVLCDVQVVQHADQMAEALQRLSSGATDVFAAQEDRHFHIGIAFAGDDVQVAYFDRAGRVSTGPLNIHENPVFFLRTVMGLTIIDESFAGKDTSISTRGGDRYVIVNGVEYRIVETLSRFGDVRGRGTTCWRCRRPGSDDDYVIKQTWANVHQRTTEGQFLKKAERVAGVIDLVDEEVVVRSNGLPQNTVWLRDFLQGSERLAVVGHCPRLELRRLVLRTCGRPLADFSSKEELISAVRDAVQASYDLLDTVDILHCDINADNIMLRHELGSAFRRGFLIDFDSATNVSPWEGLAPYGHFAGTFFFMAIDVVQYAYGIQHAPWHDLESFLYVLMFICTTYSGPSNAHRLNFDIYTSPLAPWFAEGGHEKACIMRQYSDSDFRAFLDSVFDPYFDDLKDLVCELRTLITRRRSGPQVHHTEVLDVLDRHLRARTEPRYAVTPLDMPTIMEANMKRKGVFKKKRARAVPAPEAPADAPASSPPPVPTLPIASATSTAAPRAPSSAIAPPMLRSTSRARPLPRSDPSRPMTRAMKRRLAQARRAASPPSDDSDRTLVDTTPERKGNPLDSPSPKRTSSASPSPEDRRTPPRRSKRLRSPDAPSDEPALHATRASKRRKVA
ncbi:hypothetical protein EV714DRAFT_273220 [Schizophyllum commune]